MQARFGEPLCPDAVPCLRDFVWFALLLVYYLVALNARHIEQGAAGTLHIEIAAPHRGGNYIERRIRAVYRRGARRTPTFLRFYLI